MRSRTSFFNGAVFKKCLSRYWPMWAAWAALWVLTLALPLVNQINLLDTSVDAMAQLQDYILRLLPTAMPFLCCCGGLAFAAASFDFLFTARGTGLMASLPLRREGAFFSCYAAGAVMLLSSGLLAALCAWGVEAAHGAVTARALGVWLGVYATESLLFYGIAVFLAMLTGHVLVLPCLYLLFNVGAALLEQLAVSLLQLFTFGMVVESWGLESLSPVVALLTKTDVVADTVTSYDTVYYGLATDFTGWGTVLGWFAAGLGLTICALLLFRHRRMESAGDTVAIPVLRPVLKYIVTAFCALGFPLGVYYILFGYTDGTPKLAAYLLLTVLGTAIGYYVSEMIIQKSVRVFRGRWKGLLVSALVGCAVVCAVAFDLTGYETRVPDAADVASVGLSTNGGQGIELRETENIEDVCDLHASIAAHKKLHEAADETSYLHLVYTLRDGRTVSRLYRIACDETQYEEGSDVRRLEALLNTAEARLSDTNLHPSIPVTADTVSYACISYTDADGESRDVYLDSSGGSALYDADGEEIATTERASSPDTLTVQELLDLYSNGIVPDIAAGTLGRCWLTYDDDYLRAYTGAEITVELTRRVSADNYENAVLVYEVLTTSENTLAWLAAHGIALG